MKVLQRELWHGEPKQLGEIFALTKGNATAVCELWSHVFGWELRLTVRGDLVQSQVCRTEDAVFSLGEEWKQKMKEKGWS